MVVTFVPRCVVAAMAVAVLAMMRAMMPVMAVMPIMPMMPVRVSMVAVMHKRTQRYKSRQRCNIVMPVMRVCRRAGQCKGQ